MSSIKITFLNNDPDQVRKLFDILMLKEKSVDAVKALVPNPILEANADDWGADFAQEVSLTTPYAVGVALKVGDRIEHEGLRYVIIQAHTTQLDWIPSALPALYLLIPDVPDGQDYANWSQPAGAHDAYALGDRVTHNGSNWESAVASNVWEPGGVGIGDNIWFQI